MHRLAFALFLGSVLPVLGEDWTVNGKEYHDVVVQEVKNGSVSITYAQGAGTLDLADLPPELQKRFPQPALSNGSSPPTGNNESEVLKDMAALSQNSLDLAKKLGAARQAGNRVEMYNDCSQIIKLDPQNPFGYEGRGLLYATDGNYDGAIADFSRYIQLCPDRIAGYLCRGKVYAKKGDDDAAIADFIQVLQRDPSQAEVRNALGLFYGKNATRCADTGDFVGAVNWENKILGLPGLNAADIARTKSTVETYQAHKTAL